MDEDEKDKSSQEALISLEVSADSMTYTLTIQSADGRTLTEEDAIINLEMWLHEITQGIEGLNVPNTQIH